MLITKEIHSTLLRIMKDILDLGEFKYGKDSGEFRFFKAEVMRIVYSNERVFFEGMNKEGLFDRCNCRADVKNGWSDCNCGGSGYKGEIESRLKKSI